MGNTTDGADACLRRTSAQKSATATPTPSTLSHFPSRYRIPHGCLFRWVSMPHYLCEMGIYTALWMMSGWTIAQGLICVWVYVNLTITALRSHRWYQSTFPHYPKDRKAVIPFIL